ncbi:MAG TPA: glycosyltransferase [Gammaproteobacteria bacterium]|nr:glycosyltransferase [Gammaproteobacteria bacterium]
MPQRIAMISDHASPLAAVGGVDSGGQNIYVAETARHLAARGYVVDVFTRKDQPDLPEIVDWVPGVRVIHVPAGPPTFVRKEELLPLMPEFSAFVQRFAAAQRYDVVHAHFFMSGLVALQLKAALGLPFAITFHALGLVRRLHQGVADEFPPKRIGIERDIITAADAIIAECPDDRRNLVTLYNADPTKIVVIPCGFAPDEFWPIAPRFARRALGLPSDVPVLLCVGRLVPRKGVDNVIRALGVLVRKLGVPAELLIVGGNSDIADPALTPEIGRLRSIAVEEGVADRVTFTGRRSRELLKLYYSAADAFVTTPWYEPFGMTPLEAMACGTPVVGARVGGIKYSVLDQRTGFLVPPNDPAALAGRLKELCCSPRLAERFAGLAVRRAYALFRWERVAQLLAILYGDVQRYAEVPATLPVVAPEPVRGVVAAA